MLRASHPSTPILHFTHIPFPEPAVLRLLPSPWRVAILRGLLGADIVGLQTPGDVRAFLSCCDEFLGEDVRVADDWVRVEDGREVRVRAYPASVDPAALRRTMRGQAAQEALVRLSPPPGQHTIIRVDRLDPSKNQLVGFYGFERLLEARPDLRPHVRFLAFLVPSRTDLSVYRAYRDAVYAVIERINQRFAPLCGEPPIQVFYENDREQALAAMRHCDALLINSRQDGMNLVAKEWAVVSERPGVLVVSETAGVASEVGDAALQISPLDVEGTAHALGRALDMDTAERAERLRRMREQAMGWTARDWLRAQLRDLGVESI
jgi:trehalose 6-phosphate synthase